MTDEIREKLKSLGGFDKDDALEIVPSQYKEKFEGNEPLIPKEFWPVFEFGQMNSIEFLKFKNLASKLDKDDEENLPDIFESLLEFLDKKLVKIRNLRNSRNPEEIIDTNGIKLIDAIDNVGIISDIAVQYLLKNQLTEEEREGLI